MNACAQYPKRGRLPLKPDFAHAHNESAKSLNLIKYVVKWVSRRDTHKKMFCFIKSLAYSRSTGFKSYARPVKKNFTKVHFAGLINFKLMKFMNARKSFFISSFLSTRSEEH